MKSTLNASAAAFLTVGVVTVGLLVGTADPAYAEGARTELEFGLNRTAKVLC